MNHSNLSIDEIHRLQKIREKCENDLIFFARYFFRELRGEKFIVNSHHHKICAALKDIERGGNLLINLPPRYGKTELGVICWIAQSIARNPKARFIHLSFSAELALENSAKCRELIKSEKYQQLWPVKIKPDADSKAKWYTEEGGGVYATQAGGAVTGFGAGITGDDDASEWGGAIIVDDPLKPDDARSEAIRSAINDRLNSTIKNRRNSRNTPIVIIMQRLHEMDMSGFVLSGGMGEPFKHVKLAALQDDGTALWPMKHSVEELQRMRDTPEDRANFWAQYQQEPAPGDGDVFRSEWFLRYRQLPPANTIKMIIHSWDTAYKADQHNDPTALTVWCATQSHHYLADCLNQRMEYPQLKRTIIAMAERDKPDAILIEDKASGQSLIQELRQQTNLPIIAVKPDADKETRARAIAAMFESQKIFIPDAAPWLDDYEKQMLLFPNAKNDDIVDSTSQYLRWVRDNHYNTSDEYEAILRGEFT